MLMSGFKSIRVDAMNDLRTDQDKESRSHEKSDNEEKFKDKGSLS